MNDSDMHILVNADRDSTAMLIVMISKYEARKNAKNARDFVQIMTQYYIVVGNCRSLGTIVYFGQEYEQGSKQFDC